MEVNNKSPHHAKYHTFWDRRQLVRRTGFLTSLVTAAVVLVMTGVTLVVCGAVFPGIGIVLFIGGTICLMLAIPMMIVYCWVTRCHDPVVADKAHTEPTVSTISFYEYYNQKPANGLKTDYPMGPHLVMTLPRTKRKESDGMMTLRPDVLDCTEMSMTSTPDFLPKRSHTMPNPSHKNQPPLASVETLTPSLMSSCNSLDTAI